METMTDQIVKQYPTSIVIGVVGAVGTVAAHCIVTDLINNYQKYPSNKTLAVTFMTVVAGSYCFFRTITAYDRRP
jgi:nitrate/nitrite transporter NarK